MPSLADPVGPGSTFFDLRRHDMLFTAFHAVFFRVVRIDTVCGLTTVHAVMAKRNAGIEERLGKAIAAQRIARGLSQAQLAEEMGVDKDTVSRFERGAVLAPMQRLIQLADIFEMPLEDLIRGASANVADAAPDIARMLAKLDDDGRRFVRHIVEELCERLAPKR